METKLLLDSVRGRAYVRGRTERDVEIGKYDPVRDTVEVGGRPGDGARLILYPEDTLIIVRR